MNRADRLGEEKINKLLWSLTAPSIIGMLSISIYNITDTIFVGHSVGKFGIAGISVALPLLMLISTFGHMIGLGGASIISRALGAKDKAKALLTLHNLVTLVLCINVVLFSLVILYLRPLLTLFGADSEILPFAYQYAIWALPGTFFMNLMFVLMNQIRAEGNAKFPMFSQIMSAVINVIIDPIFIFGFGWGLMGAGLATSISQIVMALLSIWYFTLNPKSVLKLNFRQIFTIPDKAITKEAFAIGASSFGRQVATSSMTIVLNNALLYYSGAAAIAAFGIVYRLSMIIFMSLFGINQGFMPIAGYNYGAKKYDRVIHVLKTATIWSTGVCVFALLVFSFFATPLMTMFTKDPHLIEIGAKALRIFVIAFPVVGFHIIGSGLFQVLGKAGASFFLAVSRQLLFLIPFVFIFPLIWVENGIWYSFPAADILAAIVTLFMV
ncbi:MAG: MATE family efflux transporter, partial [Bacteroidales bacterium]|nr:MATE family efflux transporter [Bacteroidales bacterium]